MIIIDTILREREREFKESLRRDRTYEVQC